MQAFRPATLFKKRFQHGYFPVYIAKFLRWPILNNICERLLLVVAASFSIQLFWQITLTGCLFLFNEYFSFNFSNSSQFPWLTINSKYSEIASCHIKLGRRKQIQFNQTKSKHLWKKLHQGSVWASLKKKKKKPKET